MFPGINLYLSMFYRRDELQLRIAMFYSAASLSGAFSGLLAAAISKMDGIGGLQGWQWIFCLEGLFTVVFVIFAYYIMPNNPDQVLTLTKEQAIRCTERLQLEATFPETEKVTLTAVLSVYKSLHLWIMFIIMFCGGVMLFGLAFFMPSIVQGFGYSPIRSDDGPTICCGICCHSSTRLSSGSISQKRIGRRIDHAGRYGWRHYVLQGPHQHCSLHCTLLPCHRRIRQRTLSPGMGTK
jgi:hypothetical protein